MSSPAEEAMKKMEIRNANYIVIRNDIYAENSYVMNDGTLETTFIGFPDRVQRLWVEFGEEDCRVYFKGISPWDFEENSYISKMKDDLFKELTLPERVARDNNL